MASSANDRILDRTIRHATTIEAFKNSEVRDIFRLINNTLEPEIMKGLEKYQKPGGRRLRLLEFKKFLSELSSDTIGKNAKSFERSMKDFARVEAAWTKEMLEGSVPLDISFNTPTVETLHKLATNPEIRGQVLNKWWGKLSSNLKSNIEQEIKVGVAAGETIDEVARRIRGTAANNFKDGTLQKTRNEARTIARTAVNHVSTQTREAVYKANSDVIKKVQWVSTLDTRTSYICISLDGSTYEVGKGPRPPAHPN